jgi:hypothetical protein
MRRHDRRLTRRRTPAQRENARRGILRFEKLWHLYQLQKAEGSIYAAALFARRKYLKRALPL